MYDNHAWTEAPSGRVQDSPRHSDTPAPDPLFKVKFRRRTSLHKLLGDYVRSVEQTQKTIRTLILRASLSPSSDMHEDPSIGRGDGHISETHRTRATLA